MKGSIALRFFLLFSFAVPSYFIWMLEIIGLPSIYLEIANKPISSFKTRTLSSAASNSYDYNSVPVSVYIFPSKLRTLFL